MFYLVGSTTRLGGAHSIVNAVLFTSLLVTVAEWQSSVATNIYSGQNILGVLADVCTALGY